MRWSIFWLRLLCRLMYVTALFWELHLLTTCSRAEPKPLDLCSGRWVCYDIVWSSNRTKLYRLAFSWLCDGVVGGSDVLMSKRGEEEEGVLVLQRESKHVFLPVSLHFRLYYSRYHCSLTPSSLMSLLPSSSSLIFELVRLPRPNTSSTHRGGWKLTVDVSSAEVVEEDRGTECGAILCDFSDDFWSVVSSWCAHTPSSSMEWSLEIIPPFHHPSSVEDQHGVLYRNHSFIVIVDGVLF